MCGIAGLISSHPIKPERLQASAEAMRHRGPDATGYLLAAPVGLAFRRLAIIDLSADGNQPMANEDGTVHVVFNGEVYNFQELRMELLSHHQFRSRTDTEVLLHGYEEWGFEGLLQRIDGMFALALWDGCTQDLWLARDRVGKKPLFYAETSYGISFASTLSALLELLPSRPEISEAALDDYLIYQAVPAPQTIYKGVYTLPPAHYAHWQRGKELEVRPYWKLSYARKIARREDDLLEELDALMRVAVTRRLISDVPLGAFLSGGVDSSLIVGLMSALGAGPVEAVNIGFDDEAFDERPFARLVAERWNVHLHEHVMAPREVFNLPEIVWHYGQPLADVSIVPTFAVARAARQHVTVVLNGDGGDEAFGGYARPIVARAAQDFRRLVPRFMQPFGARLVSCAGKKGRMLAESVSRTPREAFIYDRGLRNWREQIYAPEFLSRLNGRHPDESYRAVWDAADGPTDGDHALYGELTTYLPDQLLTKMDVSTMAHSVEARSPLLDTAVLEFAATIPIMQLTQGYQTKYLLKRLAERYVPREVLYRRKRGFVMPVGHWLRGTLAPNMQSLLTSSTFNERGLFCKVTLQRFIQEHISGQRDWSNVLWTLMVLEIWHRLFIDGTLSKYDTLDMLS